MAYLVALGFLAAGAGMVGEPLSTGGPMHFDFNLPIGIFYLTCGVVLLEWLPTASGWVYVLAALVILSAAGRNFYRYPPIDDGAYFLLRYGRNALDDWTPTQPFAPMLAFAVAGWAVARSLGGKGSRLVRLAILAVGAVMCCAVYELFMHGLIAGADPLRLGLLLCSLNCVRGRLRGVGQSLRGGTDGARPRGDDGTCVASELGPLSALAHPGCDVSCDGA